MSESPQETRSRLLSLAPQFLTTDLDQSVTFYTTSLGFRELFRFEGFYAAVARDGATIHLKHSDEPDPSHEFKSRNEHLDVYISVDDVDGLCAEFLAGGVELLRPLHDTEWNTREFAIRDRDGYLLYFGRSNSSPER